MGLSVGAFTHSKDRKARVQFEDQLGVMPSWGSLLIMTFLVSITEISNKKRSDSVNETKEHTN